MSETADRIRIARERRRREGLVRVDVWVPEDQAISFRAAAAEACRAHANRRIKSLRGRQDALGARVGAVPAQSEEILPAKPAKPSSEPPTKPQRASVEAAPVRKGVSPIRRSSPQEIEFWNGVDSAYFSYRRQGKKHNAIINFVINDFRNRIPVGSGIIRDDIAKHLSGLRDTPVR